jgi:hypothetical protein
VRSFRLLPPYPGKISDLVHWVGNWVGPTIDLDIAAKIRFFATTGNQNSFQGSPARSLVRIPSVYRSRIVRSKGIAGGGHGILKEVSRLIRSFRAASWKDHIMDSCNG